MSSLVVPEVATFHELPKSVVVMTSPPSPTATQSLLEPHETPFRFALADVKTDAGIVRKDQLRPPLVVRTALGSCSSCGWPICAPTATHREDVGQEMPSRPFCIGPMSSSGLQLCPPLVVFAIWGTAPKVPPTTQHVFVPFTQLDPWYSYGVNPTGACSRQLVLAVVSALPDAPALELGERKRAGTAKAVVSASTDVGTAIRNRRRVVRMGGR